jgi:integrase
MWATSSSGCRSAIPAGRCPGCSFSVKAVTGCRLEDVCSLRSSQLQDVRLVFAADITKNRSERYAILPADLYAAFAYKGKAFLWERYPAELIAANDAKGYPTHRQKAEFTPQRLYLWVLQVMGYYHKGMGHGLRPHDFRRAAFTRAAEKDIQPQAGGSRFRGDAGHDALLLHGDGEEKGKRRPTIC